MPLSNSGLGFRYVDVLQKNGDGFFVSALAVGDIAAASGSGEAKSLVEARLAALTTPRPDYAGLSLDRFRLMGIVNVTPDSFSDGGTHTDPESALMAGRNLAAAGADILDIGGESTRPGASAVDADAEWQRIGAVISGLAAEGHKVSVDTRRCRVMASALDAGAVVLNDISGLRDEGSATLAAARDAAVVIMHMQGEPATMQHDPVYDFAPADVYDWLEQRLDAVIAAGVKRHNIAVDVGFGFGKKPRHNLELMDWLAMFHGLGVPILLGVSRKSTIAHYSRGEPPDERLAGSIAMATLAHGKGVRLFRVHDVAETFQALSVAQAVMEARV